MEKKTGEIILWLLTRIPMRLSITELATQINAHASPKSTS